MGLRFFCVGGGGSQEWAVALPGAHTPSNNPAPLSGTQAYIASTLVRLIFGGSGPALAEKMMVVTFTVTL